MNYFIYLTIIFLSFYGVAGCKNKSSIQKADSSTTIEKLITKDSAFANTISSDYSGVYEGKISVNTGSTAYELVDGWIAFDFSNNKNIVLYDGVFIDETILVKNEVKGLGKFGDNNKQIGFNLEYIEDDFDEGNVKISFIRKTGNIEAAKEKINYYKEEKALFERFYSNFKQVLINKDYKKIASYGKFPMDDESNHSKIISSEQLEKKLRSTFDENYFKEDYNIEGLNNVPSRFEDHYPGKEGGVYMLQTGVIFICFKKIGDSIKIYSVSHPYG